MVSLIIMNVCFAAALPLLKNIVGVLDPWQLVAFRMLPAGILLCLYQAVVDWRVFLRPLRWSLLVLCGALSMCFLCVAEAWALEGMSATKATLMWATLPIFTMLIGHMLGRESLSWRNILSVCAGLVGVLLLVYASDSTENFSWIPDSVLHELAMLSAIVAAACGYFSMQLLVCENYPVVLSNGITMVVGGALSLLLFSLRADTALFENIVLWPMIGYLALVIIVVNFVGLYLQTALAKKYSATLLALSSFITPLAGVVLGVLLQGDSWNLFFSAATFCISGGLCLLYYSEIKQVTYGI